MWRDSILQKNSAKIRVLPRIIRHVLSLGLATRLDATTHEQHAIRTELADALERLHKLERRHDEEICALSERAQRLEDRFRELELKCHTERILTLESQHILERDRLDWALGLLEGLAEELQKYQFARQDPTYWDAYAKASPLVSVCIATSDRSALLVERALRSVLAQSYRNLQIIIVGDHCTDDTEQRLAEIRDSRITFVNLPERGPYPPPGIDRWRVAGTNAMNRALELCEGDFVTHLDDDDAMTGNRIETLLTNALEHRADFLWHRFRYQRPDGEWITLGNGEFVVGQVTTGSVFYHRYFTRFPWDVNAYRMSEPGDWNRFRKIKLLRPQLYFVNEPLLLHFRERNQPPFLQQTNERFLDD
ncbi:glycosyltransferase family 2 protein [Camelimonas abortus]|uniref:Glycosyltransferase family 2 protein n=1 Tax=Camelimonas abortus TaxID=1017184 RepID=A0ABV7LJG4_9HYPH